MIDQFLAVWSGEAVRPASPPLPIRSAPLLPLAPVAPVADRHIRRAFVGDERNSCLPFALPLGIWHVAAEVALDANIRPTQVLPAGGRIVVEGEGPWRLFDSELRRVGFGYRAGGGITLDPEHGLFWFQNPSGMLVAHGLADGRKMFAVPLVLGAEYERLFVARRKSRLLAVARETALDPHAHEPPKHSLVEVTDLGDPPERDPEGFLLSATGQGDLLRETLRMLPALHDETLVLATDHRIYVLDLDLTLQAALDADFVPLSMSLDEVPRAYLVAETNDGPALWVLTLQGERVVEAPLPLDFLPTLAPPIVSRAHDVFLVAHHHILAFDPRGERLWEWRPIRPIAGVVVTADGQLLVCAGSELFAFDADGRSRSLIDLGGDALRTPPVLDAYGALLVATGQRLYRLEVRTNDRGNAAVRK